MKSKLIKILSLCMVFALALSFAACSDKEEPKKDSATVSSSEPTKVQKSAPAKTEEKADPSVEATASPEDAKPKYADVEIYEKEGVKYAKTEDGTEVEMTGENLQDMMQEYVKVQGSGTDEEKEILDRIQVILDNADRLQ